MVRASFVQGTVNPGTTGGATAPFLPDSGYSFSGTPAFDQPFTVTSTNNVFGNTGPTLVIFDDFRTGTPGSVVPDNTPGVAGSSNWQGGSTSFGNPIYETPNASGSGNCIRIYNDNRSAGSYQLLLNFANTNQLYICWKENSHGTDYTTFSNNFGNNWNYKLHWFLQNGAGTVGGKFNEWLPAIFATFSGSTFTGTNMQIASNDVPPLPDEFFTSGSPYDPNNWNTCEFGYVGNVANPTTAAGLLFHSVYNPTTTRAPKTQGQYTFSKTTDILFNPGSGSKVDYTYGNTLTVPGLMQGEPAGVIVDRADYYVAIGPNCLNRFFIGDAPTIQACTTITPCTINSWSAGSVTMVLRKGAFESPPGNYLYWSDNNNNIQRVGQFNPLSLPLVQSTTPLLTYLGSFNGPTDGSFQYGGGGLSVSNSSPGVLGQLVATGIQQGNCCLGVMNIPAPTGPGGTYTGTETASTVVVGTTSIPVGNLGGDGSTISVAVGGIIYGGKSYVTGAISYDSTGSQNAWLLVGNTNLTGFGAPCGAQGSAGTTNSRLFAQGLAIVPQSWQPILGGPLAITGGIGGYSVISNQDCGFHYSTFNPANVVNGQAVPIKEWLTYPFTNTGNTEQVSKLYGLYPSTQSNWNGAVGDNLGVIPYAPPGPMGFIVPGSRTLLFVHCAAYGPAGNPHSSPCDPGNSGSNDTPITPDTQPYRRLELVAYDLAQVISARQNNQPIDSVQPYTWWPFPNAASILGSGPQGSCYIAAGFGYKNWSAYDYANNRLYVSMGWPGINGTVYVFKVNGL